MIVFFDFKLPFGLLSNTNLPLFSLPRESGVKTSGLTENQDLSGSNLSGCALPIFPNHNNLPDIPIQPPGFSHAEDYSVAPF
jgi:hypothetical protein